MLRQEGERDMLFSSSHTLKFTSEVDFFTSELEKTTSEVKKSTSYLSFQDRNHRTLYLYARPSSYAVFFPKKVWGISHE